MEARKITVRLGERTIYSGLGTCTRGNGALRRLIMPQNCPPPKARNSNSRNRNIFLEKRRNLPCRNSGRANSGHPRGSGTAPPRRRGNRTCHRHGHQRDYRKSENHHNHGILPSETRCRRATQLPKPTTFFSFRCGRIRQIRVAGTGQLSLRKDILPVIVLEPPSKEILLSRTQPAFSLRRSTLCSAVSNRRPCVSSAAVPRRSSFHATASC